MPHASVTTKRTSSHKRSETSRIRIFPNVLPTKVIAYLTDRSVIHRSPIRGGTKIDICQVAFIIIIIIIIIVIIIIIIIIIKLLLLYILLWRIGGH